MKHLANNYLDPHNPQGLEFEIFCAGPSQGPYATIGYRVLWNKIYKYYTIICTFKDVNV